DVTYTRFYRAAGDALTWTAAGGSMLAVHGFTSPDVVVYDASKPGSPLQLPARVVADVDGYTLQLTVPGTGPRTLWAAGSQGRASYDAHNYLNLGSADLVPTGYVNTTFTGRTPSDSSLVLGIHAPPPTHLLAPTVPAGVALGRLPAHDPAEAAALVGKLVAYS